MPSAFGKISRAECVPESTGRHVSLSMVNGTTARAASNLFWPRCRIQQSLREMINPTTSSRYVPKGRQVSSREIQLFEPLADALYTIESTSRIVDVPRRTLLVYCKHHLVSPATGTADHGYYFDGDAIHTLRRIETLRTVCGDDFAGIKIILDLTAALERLRSDLRLLSRAKRGSPGEKGDREILSVSPKRFNVKSSSWPKRK